MRAAQPDPAAARADVAERFSRDDMDALKRAIARVAKTQATVRFYPIQFSYSSSPLFLV